jgi:hypothetical protein
VRDVAWFSDRTDCQKYGPVTLADSIKSARYSSDSCDTTCSASVPRILPCFSIGKAVLRLVVIKLAWGGLVSQGFTSNPGDNMKKLKD